MNDPHDLQRFVDAQDHVYAQVRAELQDGCKRSHWMWFVFPQIDGLGVSSMAKRYAIRSLDEAIAYMRHPVLGPRLVECTRLVNAVTGIGIRDIFGYPDYLKFCSCMTLFARAAPEESACAAALEKYFEGEADEATLDRL